MELSHETLDQIIERMAEECKNEVFKMPKNDASDDCDLEKIEKYERSTDNFDDDNR